MRRHSRPADRYVVAAILAAALLLGWRLGGHSVDFPVYYRAAQAWRAHRPLYGPASGLAWPMYYRYPPLFVLLFAPLLILPLSAAAATWLTGKVAALLALGGGFARGFGWPSFAPPWRPQLQAWLAAIFLALPYLVLEFRYGNVEFYIVALCMAALLLVRRPAWAGALLGLGIAIKIWPLFFVPYWLVTQRRRAAFVAVATAVALTLAPTLAFGWAGNLHLLADWFRQEAATGLHAGTIWYPGQSLRGVLTRLLPFGHVAVTRLWLALDLAAYAAFLAWAARTARPGRVHLESDAAAFCAVALLAPFTHVEDLVLLLWPALVLGLRLHRQRAVEGRGAVALCCLAALMSGLIPLIPGRVAQHWLELHSADFLVVALLAAGFLWAMAAQPRLAQVQPSAATARSGD